MENVENKETIIEEVTEEKEETKKEYIEVNGISITAVAVAGAIRPLADKSTYIIGVGAGLLFGKKTGLKTIGALLGVNALYNTARFVTGGVKFENKK